MFIPSCFRCEKCFMFKYFYTLVQQKIQKAIGVEIFFFFNENGFG
jgi:hypothetical protein